MSAINLALRNLYGYVIWGDRLAGERRLIYRTGFESPGFVREFTASDDSESAPRLIPPVPLSQPSPHATDDVETRKPVSQLRFF